MVDGKRCSLRLGITRDRTRLISREKATNAKSMAKEGMQRIMRGLAQWLAIVELNLYVLQMVRVVTRET